MKKIILFELNEVPLRIIDYFIRESPRSHLARIWPKLAVYETFTEDDGHLSPWKTWPSLHRGTAAHGLTDFGQSTTGIDERCPPVWRILAAHGVTTGVFGSLHSHPVPSVRDAYSFYVPDVFSPCPETLPSYVEPFQALSLAMSRASVRNVSLSIPMRHALACLAAWPRLGIRMRTVGGVLRQLRDEQQASWKAVRRRTWQSALAFDIYLKLLRRHRPRFTTFFTNHVASAMHRYWAAAFPGDYETLAFDAAWIERYRGEVLFAMGKADEMIGDLARFAEEQDDYEVLVASSMGQAAVTAEPVERQVWIGSPGRFFAALGFEPQDWIQKPAMFPQFNVMVREAVRERFTSRLESVEIAGQKLTYRTHGEGFFSLDFGHVNVENLTVRLDGEDAKPEQVGIENLRIDDRSNASAYHIPQGALLIFDPTPGLTDCTRPVRISALEIAPYILRRFGVERPDYMRPGILEIID